MFSSETRIGRRRDAVAWFRRRRPPRGAARRQPPSHDIVHDPARAALRVVLIGAMVLAAVLLLCWNAGLLKHVRSPEWRSAPLAFTPSGRVPQSRPTPAD